LPLPLIFSLPLLTCPLLLDRPITKPSIVLLNRPLVLNLSVGHFSSNHSFSTQFTSDSPSIHLDSTQFDSILFPDHTHSKEPIVNRSVHHRLVNPIAATATIVATVVVRSSLSSSDLFTPFPHLVFQFIGSSLCPLLLFTRSLFAASQRRFFGRNSDLKCKFLSQTALDLVCLALICCYLKVSTQYRRRKPLNPTFLSSSPSSYFILLIIIFFRLLLQRIC
jgi:hypothetical protein